MPTSNLQLTINWTPVIHSHENNRESESILNDNKERFTKQCRIVLDALLRGERLTTSIALERYKIGDLRARCRDLIKFNSIDVSKELMKGRYKEYFLELSEIQRIKGK